MHLIIITLSLASITSNVTSIPQISTFNLSLKFSVVSDYNLGGFVGKGLCVLHLLDQKDQFRLVLEQCGCPVVL